MKKSRHKPSKPRPTCTSKATTSVESIVDPKLLVSKLFKYLVCHCDDCRLGISNVVKRLQKFSGGKSFDEKAVLELVSANRDRFELKTVEGLQFVEAKTIVKICDLFQEGKCRPGLCKGLHICRFFLEETCKFGDECKNPHTFDVPHTKELLERHKLCHLPDDALKILFRKVLKEKKMKYASSISGPSTCKFYNKGDCKNGDKCEFLHVCEHYVDGDCKFGAQRCKRSHSFESAHSRKVLASHNLGGLRNERQILSVLQRNRSESPDISDDDDMDVLEIFLKKLATGGHHTASGPAQTIPFSTTDCSKEKLEICGFNLRGKCNYGSKCNLLHAHLPYQWQYCFHSQWKDLVDNNNQQVEIEFCDHEVDDAKINLRGIGSLLINFQRMTGEMTSRSDIRILKIRRLSTISSVVAASGHVFSTTWKWYWLDEHDQWCPYDGSKAETTSEEIEEKFQSGSSQTHTFSAGSNKYTLHFEDVNDLYQQNDRFETKRKARRRPAKYLDEKAMKQVLDDFKHNRKRKASSSSSVSVASYPLPSTWSSIDPSEEFMVVDLSEILHFDELQKVKAQFVATMTGFKVQCVKRVQNPSLWEDYERQKSRMTKKNLGQCPKERWLFHGTTQDIVEPICQQGFDWRLSGSKHGARYGKGSYFAVEASYSHTYSSRTEQSGSCRVFLAKVIVGSYVAGSYETQRPPAKDKSNPLSPLHDSCVNNVTQPTIFVVFERSQAYPYYIIEYTK